MEQLIQEQGKLIASLADKMCRRFGCSQLREDLISSANLALLQKAGGYDASSEASMTTYLYPHLVGAMRRELERSLYPMSLPKDIFHEQGAFWKSAFSPLEEYREQESPADLPVERQVLREIYLDCVREEFERLSFKERQILGGFFGVFDYPKQTLANLAEEFQMTENALIKAKDKALVKLRLACENGQLGIWREARSLVRDAQRECRGADYSTPQSLWYMEEREEK
ncbi:MAG: sigma-70 family RNA polymerase sigma factor [Oscillospiraceae bacterium]|nr:sigma-70 family RNA polymerase sigma factor [Oscillospiraceae bacterium]